ncbi:MAG: hypothetical protein IMF11_01050, partial [Proteobacteria bacterium]|nr:hypothetical protein [Pseudomonadota bacterium]
MNIIKGIDRIALVIAIIAILPGFGIGFNFINAEFKTVSPEYEKWEEKKQERLENLRTKREKEREKAKKEEEKALQEEIERSIENFEQMAIHMETKRKEGIRKNIRSRIIEERKTKRPWLYKDYYQIPRYEPKIEIGEPPNQYDYPAVIWCIITGLLSATVSFLVVLYSIRGMTRGTRWFALWII